MLFTVLSRFGSAPYRSKSQVFLTWDDWNDYSFYTLFGIFYVDENSKKHDLGGIKIGFFGQQENDRVLKVGDSFERLNENFFSLGVEDTYYQALNDLGDSIRDEILNALNDIAKKSDLYERAIEEDVTKSSFLRGVSPTTITGQFRRLAMGGSRLTDYHFEFSAPITQDDVPPMVLSFNVEPASNPPTNIHILIGRNGVGKTFLINNMVDTLTQNNPEKDTGEFTPLPKEGEPYLFANLICITFSAFDEFDHPPEVIDKSKGLQYSYIGLKEVNETGITTQPKNPTLLKDEFVKSFTSHINITNSKLGRWIQTIKILESDPMFKEANIAQLSKFKREKEIEDFSAKLFRRLSSGHKIILLTITRLVETLQERSLVLIDEPEAHLHPPLLSAFTRALSELLIDRNAVSIIATHSPVILQEAPKSCVWKLRRNGAIAFAERLEIESFGENVGVLTQEVFGLEVSDSGFHNILKDIVSNTRNYDEAIEVLNGQIGLEAKAILRGLFYQKGQGR